MVFDWLFSDPDRELKELDQTVEKLNDIRRQGLTDSERRREDIRDGFKRYDPNYSPPREPPTHSGRVAERYKAIKEQQEAIRRQGLTERERRLEDIKEAFSKYPSREEMIKAGMLVRDGRGGWKMRSPY